jgi:hypothetical protein
VGVLANGSVFTIGHDVFTPKYRYKHPQRAPIQANLG